MRNSYTQARSRSASALAHAATPPAALRARVLASVAPPANVIQPPLSLFRTFLPWAVAACFALSAAWLGQLYVTSRSEAALLESRRSVAELALKSTQQQLEAERILTRRRLADTEQQIASASQQLADARTQLGSHQQRIAALTEQLKREGDLANLKIAALASKLNNSPDALAIAVWDPAKQQGVLKVEKLPALAADKDYQLWIVDPQYPNPVDGGVFRVDPVTGEQRVQFKGNQAVREIAAFAVTLERKGGVPKAEGPFVLLGK